MFVINIISIYLLLAAMAVVFCTVQIKTLNGSSYTNTALLLCFAICIYILGYTIELNSDSASQIMFWNQIEYIGIPFVSALWLTTALIYTGHFSRYKTLLIIAIFGIPIVTFILRSTNSYHHLYFATIDFEEKFDKLFFVKQAGPWMYVQAAHSALMIIISMGLFIYDSAKNSEKHTGKFLLLIIASAFAVLGLVLIQIKPFNYPIDYMALCLPITCITVILAIMRFDLLEVKSMARYRAFEISNDAIILINHKNRILDYNNSARKLFEQVGIRLNNLSLTELLDEHDDLLEKISNTEQSVIELQINDEDHYFDITTDGIDDRDAPRGWIKTIRDVTEIYRLNNDLKKQAMTDELSVLSNRRAFILEGKEWVAKSEESGGALYLLMIDLDHFKNVNDQYGHPTGDLVIHDIAHILKTHFVKNSLVARLGGDEFAVLLNELDDGEVLRLLEALMTDTEQHEYDYFGNRFHITISAGLTKKQPGQSLEDIMRNADRALYQSKERQRNCYTVL